MNTSNKHFVYLLLGSNLGDREENLSKAIALLKSAGEIKTLSSVYETSPWGFNHPVPFLNRVILLWTSLNPTGLLKKIIKIENELGRLRAPSNGYEARTIDVDILFFGNNTYISKNLIIPHPKMAERKFTLTPLAEIAPDLIHPVLNKKVSQLFASCRDLGKVTLFKMVNEK